MTQRPTTLKAFQETLKTRFDDFTAKKLPAEALASEVAAALKALPLNEQDLAMGFLRSIPGLGELLANLQKRNGYDFDNRAGNIYRGHAGFPSIADSRTALERMEADKRDIIAKLANLQNDIQLTKDGLTNNSQTSPNAMFGSANPIKKALQRKEEAVQRYQAVLREQAVGFMRRLNKVSAG
jgi:hypothetical protein